MRNTLNIPGMEDEEKDMFETSPLMDELAQQQAVSTPVPDADTEAVEQEMSAEDEIQNETADLMQAQETNPEMDRLAYLKNLTQNYQAKRTPTAEPTEQDEMRKLQEDARKRDQMLTWFRLGDKAAAAYGSRHGAKVEDNSDIFDSLSKQAYQPVTDYKDSQKNEGDALKLSLAKSKRSPESNISKFKSLLATIQAKKAGLTDEQAADLQKMSADELDELKMGSMGSSAKNQYQTKFVTNPNTGVVEMVTFDTTTGTVVPTSMNGSTAPLAAGYKPDVRKDARTNEQMKIVANLQNPIVQQLTGPSASGSSVQPTGQAKPGETQKQFSEFDLQNSLDTKKYEQFENVRKQFAGEVKEDKAAAAKVDGVLQMLKEAEKNPAAAGAASAAVARLFEKGVMTDEDVKRYAIRHGILNKLTDSFNRFTVGEFSPDLAKDVGNSIKAYQSGVKDSINKRALDYGKQFRGAINPNNPISENDIARMMYPEYGSGGSTKKDKTVEEYAKKFNLDYNTAKATLVKRGHKLNEQ